MGGNSNVSTISATPSYRNETFIVPWTLAAGQANKTKVAIGIIRNYFDYIFPFTWDVSVPHFSETSMNVHVYVNGSNTVTDLAISYMVTTNLMI